MAKCNELSTAECEFLKALEKVFKANLPLSRNFQIGHRLSHRVAALAEGEVLMLEPEKVGSNNFRVTKQKKPAKAAPAAAVDPCCYWCFECTDPDDPDSCELICNGGC